MYRDLFFQSINHTEGRDAASAERARLGAGHNPMCAEAADPRVAAVGKHGVRNVVHADVACVFAFLGLDPRSGVVDVILGIRLNVFIKFGPILWINILVPHRVIPRP